MLWTYYDIPDKIKILDESESVTEVTDVTLPGRVNITKGSNLGAKNNENKDRISVNEREIVGDASSELNNNTKKHNCTLPETVTRVTTVTKTVTKNNIDESSDDSVKIKA
jgi:hypothetical protein